MLFLKVKDEECPRTNTRHQILLNWIPLLVYCDTTGAYMYLKIMFYSEALNSCQFAPTLGSYAILHYWALVLGLYFWLSSTVPPRVPTPHSHILYKTYERIFLQKDLLVLGGGGGAMLKKYFSICYMFITENDYFNQKIK